jgi:hypothetical protein
MSNLAELILLISFNHLFGKQPSELLIQSKHISVVGIFLFGATAPIWALAYLHETLRFT